MQYERKPKKVKAPEGHATTTNRLVLVVNKTSDRSLSLRPDFEQNPLSGENRNRVLRKTMFDGGESKFQIVHVRFNKEKEDQKELLRSLYDCAKKNRLMHMKEGKLEPNYSAAIRRKLRQNILLEKKDKESKDYIRYLEEALPQLSSDGKVPQKSADAWKTLECTCKSLGCIFFLGRDDQGRIFCGNPSFPLNPKILDRATGLSALKIGELCQKTQEEIIQLQKILGRNVTRKHSGLLITMGKKLAVYENDVESFKKQDKLKDVEITRLTNENLDLTSKLRSNALYESKFNDIQHQLHSLREKHQSEIMTLNQKHKSKVQTLEAKNQEVSEMLDMIKRFRISCPRKKGETLANCMVCKDLTDCSTFGILKFVF